MFIYIIVQLLVLCNIGVVAQSNIDNATPSERLITVGDSYVMVSNYDKACELYLDALKSANSVDEKWSAIEKIVDVNTITNNNRSSLELLETLTSDDIAKRDSTMMMNVHNKQGYVYFCLKDYVRSIKSYYKGRSYMKGSADRIGKANLLCNIAQTLIIAGDVREAEQQLNKATEICPESSTEIMANIYGLYAKVYEQYGDFNKAYRYLTRQLKTENNLWQNERSELIGTKNPWSYYQKIEQNVNNEKRIAELEGYIETQNNEYDSISGICRVALVLAILFLICGIILAVICYNRNKKIAKLNDVISEKQRILSIVSHNLITPFNSLIGLTELQLQCAHNKNDQEMVNYSRTVYETTQSMYQMASSLLIWSQHDMHMAANKEVIHIADAVAHVVEIYKFMAVEKNIHVETDIDEHITALVDRNHFDIILRNLIGNSLKFTLNGGKVRISAMQNEEKTSLIIDDTGIGIPAEECEKINNNELAMDPSNTMDENGVGLGMIICRDLTMVNDAIFGVDSVEGKGTTITIVLNSK